MTLYHGSPVKGIKTLTPHVSTHGKPYVYLTDNPDLAVIYAHNVLPPPYGCFPYSFKNGELHYDEVFPGQLEELYHGYPGYLYTCEVQGLRPLDRMNWIYLSEQEVPVSGCRSIPDLYEEILRLEKAGRVVLHRYETQTEEQLSIYRRLIREEVEQLRLLDKPENPYMQFISRHFPGLF